MPLGVQGIPPPSLNEPLVTSMAHVLQWQALFQHSSQEGVKTNICR